MKPDKSQIIAAFNELEKLGYFAKPNFSVL